jgi:hypothetical protein
MVSNQLRSAMKLREILMENKDDSSISVKDLVYLGRPTGFKLNKDLIHVALNGVRLDKWEGDFELDADKLNLTSLEGCPKITNGYFSISGDNIMSLNGGPEEVRSCYIETNNIKNLIGGPKIVKNECTIIADDLTSLEGAPTSCEKLSLFGCNSLKSLEGITSDMSNLTIDFSGPGKPSLKSLHNIHKQIKKLTTLSLKYCRFTSNVLGLLKINGLKEIKVLDGGVTSVDSISDTYDVMQILNKYLPNTGGNDWVMQCQTELIEAGFREYAKL